MGKQTMTIQVLDKFGNAIARRENIWSLEFAERWLNSHFPNMDALGQTLEIFYDETPSFI